MSSTTMKIGLLALVSTVAAVPHYSHSKFHSLHGTGKPYPTGGAPGNYNGTAVPYPTGTGSSGDDKTTTVDETSTQYQTIYSTVYVKPSPVNPSSAAGAYQPSAAAAAVQDVSTGGAGTCGPATVTVTASEKVTVTVTPGGGYVAPSSANTPAAASSAAPSNGDYGYGAPSSNSFVLFSPTPAAAKSSTPAAPVAAQSSSSAMQYSAETPKAAQTSSSMIGAYAASVSVAAVAPSSVAPMSSVHSSAAPSATPASSGNSYSGAKRGLAYNDASLCKSVGSNFGFGYNWGQVESNDIGANFIPMMAGPTKGTVSDWLANVDTAVKKGSTAVMGFNECDDSTQCNMTPEAACASWKQYMNPIKSSHPDVTIIGPSVTNGGAPMGLDWLTRFNTACPDAIADATNIHFYDIYQVSSTGSTTGQDSTIGRFKAHVEQAASSYGKKVWVTEFGLNPGSATDDEAASFLKDCMAYLDSSDVVQGYSWFMVGTGQYQLNSGSGLSSIGQVYASGSY